jgi:hypothetical protein
MILSTLCAAAMLANQGNAVEFKRLFTKGERAQYKVHSILNTEVRQGDLETWIPQDLDLIYNFNYEVLQMKADGICVMRYTRPTMTEVQGETAESQPISKTEKVNLDFTLTVSPINEILDMKENPKPKPATKPRTKPEATLMAMRPAASSMQLPFVSQFIGEIYRMALFVGSLDSSMDFAPALPVYEVKPGDSWKKTVSFSPQKLAGKGEQIAVQRIDYNYTFKGLVDVNGKKYLRIRGDVAVNSDIAAYIHQVFNVKSDVTGLKEIPMTYKGSVDFDLDPKTHQTIRAVGHGEGGFKIVASGIAKPVQEERFKSTSTLTLAALKR